MKKEIKLCTKVWHIEIKKANEPKSYSPNGIFINEHSIIGISKYKICINNDWFSTFNHAEPNKKKESYNSYLNDIKVIIRTNDRLFDNGIFIDLYTTSKPTKATLNKMVATACVQIKKEYGWIFNGIDDDLCSLVDDFKL